MVPQPLDLSSRELIRLLPDDVRYWVEERPAAVAQVAALPELAWASVSRSSIAVNVQNQPVWFRFEVANSSAIELTRLLEVRWINFSYVDFYVLDHASGAIDHSIAGLRADPDDMRFRSTSWIHEFNLPPGESRVVLLRVHTLLKTFLPVFIASPEAFAEGQLIRYIFYSLAMGMLLSLALYYFSLFIFVRDNSYCFYAVYCVAAASYIITATGVGNYLIWWESPWWRANAFTLAVVTSFITANLFLRSFLQLWKEALWLKAGNLVLIAGWFVLGTIQVATNVILTAIIEAYAMFSCLFGIVIGVHLWRRGNPSARFFTLAWSGLIGLSIVTVMMTAGLLPYNAVTANAQIIGFLMELILLSFALAERINRERLQREQAQARVIDMQLMANQEREAKLAAQADMLRVQQSANEQLEARVAERTEALEITMTNLELANRELSKLSVTDPLTQLNNRRYFDENLAREIERSNRTGQPTTLILIDIDHFKQFNDCYGHLVGDDCLRLVAKTLAQRITRSTDLIARYGGEEFAVILASTDLPSGLSTAEELRTRVESLQFVYRGKRIPISVSLGVAATNTTGEDSPVAIIERADAALYAAKSAGRNCARSA